MTSTRPTSPLSFAIASATSPWISVELFHPIRSSVREATNFGPLFSRPRSGSRPAACGQ